MKYLKWLAGLAAMALLLSSPQDAARGAARAMAQWHASVAPALFPLLALMPHGSDYAAYAHAMPWLVAMTALTTGQVFYTNAEVSAGRFGFLAWLVPLHLAYPAALFLSARLGYIPTLDRLLVWFGAASALRFAISMYAIRSRTGDAK